MELTLESLKSLLHAWPTFAEQRANATVTMTALDYVDSPISYSDFFAKYIVSNVPCLLGDWITRSWPSTSSWYHQESERIQWDHLSLHFGEFTSLISNTLHLRDVSNRLPFNATSGKAKPIIPKPRP